MSLWKRFPILLIIVLVVLLSDAESFLLADPVTVPRASVPGQPLAANARRVLETLDYIGSPLPPGVVAGMRDAIREEQFTRIQELLDPHVLAIVSLNPEVRVKVSRGSAAARLQQSGYTPHLIKILNESTVTRELNIASPQAGPVYAGASENSLTRQAQTELLKNANTAGAKDRFLEVEMYRAQPMTRQLSGLQVEYAIALIYSSEPGKREATIGFDVGSGTQDIGFRGEIPILFDIAPARRVALSVRDFDGSPTTARLTFRDALGHIYPPQVKRLAPDFFFQPQVYRADGDEVLLPPGTFELTYNRGPEYRTLKKEFRVPDSSEEADSQLQLDVPLKRWVNPMDYGFYCGDHHIHGAGCAHYENPTEGVQPPDMFAQVQGEGLNVGCVLTWGPCFDYQRRFFSPIADQISKPWTILKYDLEISGFGSAALGHVCLLRLKDQTYPGSAGTKVKGWPTWTVPVMRWAKEQGGVTGYPHSAMHVNPQASARRFFERFDGDDSESLTRAELKSALLPQSFADLDENQDASLSLRELEIGIEAAANELPNLCVPEMNGAGAMEICVSTAEGVCDFISAMDTERIPELNTWYHLMNCGFPLKLSGETDFPCMSSRRVGQGRVYVQLGQPEKLDFYDWCEGLKKGESYVSDGFAHALEFTVQGQSPGMTAVSLDEPARVAVRTKVAFASEQPLAVAHGGILPRGGRRVVGDTRLLHAPRDSGLQRAGQRLVELMVNGKVVAEHSVEADDQVHELEFETMIHKSSWVAIRQFPQLHTNPVNVIVAGEPIRASADSARWCEETIHLLWKNRKRFIAPTEQPAARAAYDRALLRYQQIAREAGGG